MPMRGSKFSMYREEALMMLGILLRYDQMPRSLIEEIAKLSLVTGREQDEVVMALVGKVVEGYTYSELKAIVRNTNPKELT